VSLYRRRRPAAAAPAKAYSPDPPSWQFDDLRARVMAYVSTPDRERIGNDFAGYVAAAYKASGPVFAAITARQLVFAEARFAWRRWSDGQPGDLFGSPDLALLERPWTNGTTGELMARMEIDASLAGSSYWTTVDDAGRYGHLSIGGKGRRMVWIRPDWVTIIVGSPSDHPDGPDALDARIVAFEYQPRRRFGLGKPLLLLPKDVAQYSPLPDPDARFRGMSWLTPVLREIEADKAATKHKLKFYENGAQPGISVNIKQEMTTDQFEKFVDLMDAQHKGIDNAYKTLYTVGGADVTALTADMKQLDFKATQGAGETRIAAAARVHPVILGLSEGLAGSSLNAGNYSAAKRSFADGTIRPLWRIAAASLRPLVAPDTGPLTDSGVELTVNDRHIAYLREDAKDTAEIQRIQAEAIRTLIDGGMSPDAAVAYVANNDLGALVGQHSGLYSVQLQPAGAPNDPAGGAAA
jgi:hypothetical protein